MASIICRYLDGTSQICNTDNSTKISDIKVNGTSIGVVKYYDVNYSDEVEFVLSDTNLNVIASMFSNCYTLVSVTVGEDIENIEDGAFEQCSSLQSVILPTTLISMGAAFNNCCSLHTIVLKSSYMEYNSIRSCFIDVGYGGTLYYPSGTDYSSWLNADAYYSGLGYYGWSGTKKSVTNMPSHNVSIDSVSPTITLKFYSNELFKIGEKSCFTNIYLNGISIIDDLEETSGDYYLPDYYTNEDDEFKFVLKNHTICYGVFSNNYRIKEITNMSNVKVIGSNAFFANSLTNARVGSSVEVICENAFSESSNLTSVVIPDNVVTISSTAFNECDALTTITMGESVARIPCLYNAFSLNAIYLKNDSCRLPYNVLDDSDTYDNFFGYYANESAFEISGVTYGGTLYYPTGTDYSDWLSTDLFYLGYFGWNGVEMDIDDMPSVDDGNDDTGGGDTTDSFGLQTYDYIVFDASGGTQLVSVTVSGTPDGSLSWNGTLGDYGTKQYLGQYSDDPITVEYSITLNVNDSDARSTYFTITGTDNTGSVSKTIKIYQKDNNGNLPDDFDEDMSTGCYINLDATEYTFPASGGSYSVMAYMGYPVSGEGLSTRVHTGSIYVAWATAELQGGEIDDDGTEGNETWKITVNPNEATTTRQCSVTFSYTNYYDESTSVVFTVNQEAAEEDTTPAISAFTGVGTVNYDGSSTGVSINSLRCGYKSLNIQTPTVNVDWIILGTGTVASGTFIGYDTVMEYPVSFSTNETTENRVGVITYKGTDNSGSTYTATTTITQYGMEEDSGEEDEGDTPEDSTDTTFAPIWRDTVYTFGGTDITYGIYVESRVYVSGQWVTYDELLFKGRGYARPDETTVSVMVNKICQNYLYTIDTPFNGAVGVSNPFTKFKLKNEYGTLLHTYYFVGDWSYEPLTLGIKTNPITPYIGDGQKLFFSTLAQAQQTVKWGMKYYNGTVDYTNTEYVTNDYTTNIVVESRQKGVNTFYFNDKSYNVLPKCQCQWVLYYLNPYGGYDWFTITGRVKRTDTLETYTITQNYNNTTLEFGKKRYLSTINVSYQVNTQWLTQEQSDRMWELIESNQVWLHNLGTDEINPVVITDTQVEHKQKTNLNRMISYQINMEHSQVRERM